MVITRRSSVSGGTATPFPALYGRRAITVPRAAAGAGPGAPKRRTATCASPSPHHLQLPSSTRSLRPPSGGGRARVVASSTFRRRLQSLLSELSQVSLDHTRNNSCERCREWDFRDMDDRHKYFFKVMMGDFRSRMTIPDKFAQRFRDKIRGKITLKVYNGSTCTVVVARYQNKLVLEAGWEAFISTHDIRLADLLVFRYNGNFQFEVLVFDPSCCVKESSNVAQNCCDHVRVQQRHRNLLDSSSVSDDDQETMQSSGSEYPTPGEKKGPNQGTKKTNTSSSTCHLNATDLYSSENDQEISSMTSYIFSPFTHLTQMQRMKVEKRVQDICSSIPIFGSVMTKCNITRNPCYLGICRKYAHQYLPHESQILRLQQHGKVWQVLLCTTKRNSIQFSRGWKKFVSDNKMQIGDICLFELLKDEKMLTMNIHIIRK
ncbi:putative B3 domain-containing protein Os03g0621600 isoform X2 [Panicum virgatum]|uniref:TF-B3 domain-containing protein n=1 Tax=Panicum virgatum TaxID=38727 RepID=A0A8T0NDL8_PANVG|nr:putative B3 domain-containing protein Os03g0621600 isoform X2 [Panicum virgatum]KAG2547397.1 hypothetical protein PVAP13_9KG095600 [Panicum virgatum]